MPDTDRRREHVNEPDWRKSSRSMANQQCVEVAAIGVSWVRSH